VAFAAFIVTANYWPAAIVAGACAAAWVGYAMRRR
jgi:hypothetical protein